MNTTFKALNDPTRRRILELLREKNLTAGEIADHFEMTKPSISNHLNLLKQADLVSSRRDGQFIVYAINATVIDDIIGWLTQFLTDKN